MRQPSSTKQSFSSSDKTKILIVILFLGILLVVLGILLGLLIRRSGFQFSMPAFQAQAAPTSSPQMANAPNVDIPTPACGTSTLVIGPTTYQIQTIQPAPDGNLAMPPDSSGVAYWVNGTVNNYVFGLSPTPNNLALQTTLTTGDLVTIFWADCTTISFSVSAIDAGQSSDPALFDQSIHGMTILVQPEPSSAGFVIKGKLQEETISAPDTPIPDESGILAEISLLDTSSSPDGTTIKVGISILNYGQTAFTLSPGNISLTTQDATPLVMRGSEPSLPREIAPGSTETIYFTFPRPSTQVATLKIFTIEYDIEGY